MSDPQHLGLGELGQRLQAMGDPSADSRLRPYQGAPLPIGNGSNGPNGASGSNGSQARPASAYELQQEARTASPSSTGPVASPSIAFPGAAYSPAVPYSPPGGQPLRQAAGAFAAPALNPEPSTPRAADSLPAASHAPAPSWEHLSAPSQSPEPAAAPQASLPAPAPVPPAPVDPNAPKSGLQRAIDAIRSALPLVQKLLPLLDGNFATAIGALVAPQPSHHPPPPPVQVDLEPVERGLAEVRTSHRELRTQVQEQGTTLKRVEDQLERVREATDRNTLEQQELVEDLRSVGSRLSAFAIVGLILLLGSLGLNVYFLIQLQHILR